MSVGQMSFGQMSKSFGARGWEYFFCWTVSKHGTIRFGPLSGWGPFC